MGYSTNECIPRVVMAAMLAGRQALVSNAPGMSEGGAAYGELLKPKNYG